MYLRLHLNLFFERARLREKEGGGWSFSAAYLPACCTLVIDTERKRIHPLHLFIYHRSMLCGDVTLAGVVETVSNLAINDVTGTSSDWFHAYITKIKSKIEFSATVMMKIDEV